MKVLTISAFVMTTCTVFAQMAKPVILEKGEGELRVRRPRSVPLPAPTMLLQISPQLNGSKELVLGTEEIPPGAAIPTHKHMGMDEILLIHTGEGHARLGDKQRDVHAGAVIFIPDGTWVGVQNTGKQVMAVSWVFSHPGFDEYIRCTSVTKDERPKPMSDDEWKACQEKGHVVFEATAPGR